MTTTMIRLGRLSKRAVQVTARGFATKRKTSFGPLAPQILDALPYYEETDVPLSTDPAAYVRGAVTSAHCVDTEKGQVSTLDSATMSPSGSVVHGRYGDLGDAAKGIPLEYLALLKPAAEGAAALRVMLEKSKASGKGTFLVYGASQANGFAAAQLASSAGHAVVAVVGGEHSGNEALMECVKGLMNEPGTAVPAEYALSKKNFANLVAGISSGDDGITTASPEKYVEEFKANFSDYIQVYPDTRPAAVSEEHTEFKYMEKDREFWDVNMETFLAQYPPGSPPVDKNRLDAVFNTEQYEIFREKFWKQTSNVISGDDISFSAPHLVKKQTDVPEEMVKTKYPSVGAEFPYSFSVLNQFFPAGTEQPAGGPIFGAVIAVTPTLKEAAEKVAAAKTLRAKGEALQFLTRTQRAEYGAACSVAALARNAGAPVMVIGGSLPELESITPTDADVKEALAAMDIDDAGETRLNYFVQLYRASDFPFYADYAVHRATEVLAGPRQIIVTK
jgi:NAD(P)-dependent dehydrogenase (short-subunit alcohol dehydrogenase family)